MRTRRGLCYPRDSGFGKNVTKRKKEFNSTENFRKRSRKIDFLDILPDDLVLSILCKLSSTADSAADFGRVLMTWVLINFLQNLFFFENFVVLIGIDVKCLWWSKIQMPEIEWARTSFDGTFESVSESVCRESFPVVGISSPVSQAMCSFWKCWSLLHSWHGNYIYITCYYCLTNYYKFIINKLL